MTKFCLNGRITFNNRLYQRVCFACARCCKPISNIQALGFMLTDDSRPRCSQCNLALAKNCFACKQPTLKLATINFDTKSYHTDCFRCGQCCKSLTDKEGLYTHNSKPYCTPCHNKHFAIKCFECSHPITTNYVKFENQNYHSTCFICFKCHRMIDSTDSFFDTKRGFTCTMCDI
jgi:hypothetical protein